MGILLNSNNNKQFLKDGILTLIVAFALLLPSNGYSQEEQPEAQNNTESNPGNQQVEENRPLITTTPWQNSAGSAIGTTSSDNSDNANENSSTGSANRPAAAQRPGSTLGGPGGGDPGGNPDVPFDENMNLAFLAAGVVFAFYIAKKKLFSKTVTIKTKK